MERNRQKIIQVRDEELRLVRAPSKVLSLTPVASWPRGLKSLIFGGMIAALKRCATPKHICSKFPSARAFLKPGRRGLPLRWCLWAWCERDSLLRSEWQS